MRATRHTLLLLTAAGQLALAGCRAPGATSTSPDPSGPRPGVGSIALELTTSGGIKFAQLSYDIHGNGFHRAATLDVSSSTTISTLVGGIPFGSGYGVTLTAQDVAPHQLTGCEGSATFDVSGASTVAVPVHVTCRAAAIEPPPPPPPSVPVPRPAVAALAALLLGLGVRRARASSTRR